MYIRVRLSEHDPVFELKGSNIRNIHILLHSRHKFLFIKYHSSVMKLLILYTAAKISINFVLKTWKYGA